MFFKNEMKNENNSMCFTLLDSRAHSFIWQREGKSWTLKQVLISHKKFIQEQIYDK